MNRLLVIIAVALCAPSLGHAQPKQRKVLVLPVDGAATPEVRKRLDGNLGRLSLRIDGNVTVGQTTFAETAAAVGCDPRLPACANDVIATLAVDELVWGTATTSVDGQTVLVVHRAERKKPGTEATVIIGNPPDDAKTETALASMFGPPRADPNANPNPIPDPNPNPNPTPGAPSITGTEGDHTQRNKGIILVSGGGVMVIIALALWANESSTADAIDNHATNTVDDFHEIQALESDASTYAIVGDLLMLAGLAVGGYGGYVLYQNHKSTVSVQPAPVAGGAGISIGGTWW